MTKDEAMKLALEAMQKWAWPLNSQELEAIAALRQALEQPEQEPVVLNQFLSDVMTAAGLVRHGKQCKALATRLRVEVMRLHAAPPKQQEQEPFGYFHYDLGLELWQETGTGDGKPLYAAPPKQPWVGLTDEEIIDVLHPLVMADISDEATDYEIARAIEAKLKEKNK